MSAPTGSFIPSAAATSVDAWAGVRATVVLRDEETEEKEEKKGPPPEARMRAEARVVRGEMT